MENQTLILALTLVSIASNTALFVNWAGNRHIPGLLLIAVGATATSVGILLLTTQGRLSDVLSILLANALILGGRIPVLMGLSGFWSQEKNRLPLFAAILFLLAMAGIYYFTEIDRSLIWRLRVYTAAMVIFSLFSIYRIARGLQIERKLRPATSTSYNFGAFLALMLFAFNAVTEFILMQVRSGAPLAANDEGTSLLLLGSIFTKDAAKLAAAT